MYKIINDFLTKEAGLVVRLSDNAFIPFDPDNTDYIAYLAWCAEGNTSLPAEENT